MSIKDRVARLTNKKEEVNRYVWASYILCKTFGWDYYTLARQPIPFVLDMLKMLQYEAKKEKEASEKSKGRKLGRRK